MWCAMISLSELLSLRVRRNDHAHLRCSSSQRRRERAFSIVSAVVNVLETMTTRVRSGSRCSISRPMSRGSTFATKWSSRPLRRLMSHGVEAKRLIHELRTQITTADTDGNDGVQSLACASLRVRNQHNNNSEGTGADSLRKLLDTLTHLINLGNDVLAVHIDGLISICTESSVKNCAPLGNIQFHPCHHGVLGSIRPFQPYQLLHHLCLGRESHQLLLDLRSHSLARIIQNDVPMFNRKLFKTVGILLLTPYTEAILGAESEDVFVQFEGGTLSELSTRLSPRCVA